MTAEYEHRHLSGWVPAIIAFLLMFLSAYMLITLAIDAEHRAVESGGWRIFFIAASILVSVLLFRGLVVLQPNEAAVLLLFGAYRGSLKTGGFWWVNPFYSRQKLSLRLRNLNGDRLKVNDRAGSPIEIALVLVWKVEDTFAAMFEVDDYVHYVKVQSESALRHLASAYPYDHWGSEEETTLRGNIDDVSIALEKELQERLGKAGVEVREARLSHLAYTPEIAEAMLRRQQATAIVAARTKIVEGAVGMVQLALRHLEEEGTVKLDEERKAAMVSNLLVVLCGEHNAQPVVNAGTLYT